MADIVDVDCLCIFVLLFSDVYTITLLSVPLTSASLSKGKLMIDFLRTAGFAPHSGSLPSSHLRENHDCLERRWT